MRNGEFSFDFFEFSSIHILNASDLGSADAKTDYILGRV